jgi:hypothetical protein
MVGRGNEDHLITEERRIFQVLMVDVLAAHPKRGLTVRRQAY